MGPYDGTKKRGVLRSGVFWDKNISAHVSFNVICLFLIDILRSVVKSNLILTSHWGPIVKVPSN